MCLCGALPIVETRTEVVILQHPHERTHPFGTARIVGLCMPRSRIHVAFPGLRGDLLCDVAVPADAAVLYPHADAVDLATVPAHERPSTLVVIDGTWAHARKMYRENPWLQRLRHVRIHPEKPSRYRIRREPRADYVSTLEAIVGSLAILEPETHAVGRLTEVFDRMIDQQIAHVARVSRQGRSRAARDRPSRALSPLLADARLVVAYAESSLPGGDPSAAREVVQWVATRVATGETFEALIRPTGPWPSLHHLQHMRLCAEDLAAGEDLAAARRRFAAFAGPGAPIASWTPTTLAWGAALFDPATPSTLLKTSYCNLRNARAGYLEEVVRREGLTPLVVQCHGRARERLGSALAVARWLRSLLAARLRVPAGD